MIITISGLPGAGKTTVKRLLAKKLGWKEYSMGDLRGKMAVERGLTIDQLNSLGEKEGWTDKDVDDFQRKLGETEDDFVMEGRTSYHFIPNSFKVMLKVSYEEGARRIMGTKRLDEPDVGSLQEKVAQLKERVACDDRRYKKYYHLDVNDEKNYDIVIDTTSKTSRQVVDEILSHLKSDKSFNLKAKSV